MWKLTILVDSLVQTKQRQLGRNICVHVPLKAKQKYFLMCFVLVRWDGLSLTALAGLET